MAELVDFESRAEAAMLAAAVGDALGWPQENRGGRVGGRRGVEPQLDFVEWRRREGGRYASHEEVIGAGEYSDDTQLIAAVARSLLSGARWWERWTRLELPFWLVYERGGGGATKRAAQAWSKGSAPWTGDTRDRYFGAGGNGVAMRVLPHCLRGGDDFPAIARAVVADGVATHGHPRAHVGALAYAYALWRALRRKDRLPYGALIAETRDEIAAWAQRPPLDVPDWQEAADTVNAGGYDAAWQATVTEMADLLGVCADAISEGALSIDRETLEKLGTFNKNVSSAGTVTAAGAIFLTSRYAARPSQGLLAAAFARGADTDTLASMTSGLLAAINGGDWLSAARERVQDDRYLIRLARALIVDAAAEDSAPHEPDLRTFLHRLAQTEVGSELPLPDGRNGHLRNVVEHPTRTRNAIKTFVVETDDGQTLFLKRVRRLRDGEEVLAQRPEERRRPRVAVALEVNDLERSIAFWRDIAHLEVKPSQQYVNVGGYIALFRAERTRGGGDAQLELGRDGALRHPKQRIVVFVDAVELDAIHQRLERGAVPAVAVAAGSRRGIRCADPDGNVVEFRETNGIG